MNQANNNISETVAEIVEQVIDDLSLEDRVTMASLEDDQIEFINELLVDYIHNKLNERFIKQKEAELTEPEAIVKEVWRRSRETHKLRVVK